MRRILSIALAALMILSVATVGVFTVSAETSDELPANAKAINDGDDFASMQAGGYYYLAADITIDSTYTRPFTGTLDGQGHTVTTTVPLFANLNGSTVCNLTIAGEIDDTEEANSYVGALANAAGDATIDNVHNTANIVGVAKASVGGLVGFCRGGDEIYITNSSNSGNLSGQLVGGILAAGDGEYMEIVNCKNSGDLTCLNTGANAGFGGILADQSDTEGSFRIDNCVNTGDVTGPRPGGIFGTTEGVVSAVITDCVNTGEIISETNYAGGIACRIDAYTPATFRNCVNTGNVTVKKSQVGGILGYSGADNGTEGMAVFYGCVNTGTIAVADQATTDQSCNVGGMAGKCTGRTEYYNCVNLGDLYGTLAVAGMIAHTGSGNNMGNHVASGCYAGGNYYTTATKHTEGSRTNTSAGLIGYGWGNVLTTNCVVTANIKTDFDIETSLDNTQVVGGLVGYTNTAGGISMNNHFVGTLIAGDNVQKVITMNAVSGDVTPDLGNNISGIKSAHDYPIYFSIPDGAVPFHGTIVDAADYTDAYIAEILNEALGYQAFTVVTAEDANEFGLVGVMPTAVVTGDADPDSEAVAVGTAAEFLAMEPNGNYYLTANIQLPSTYEGVFSGILDGKGFSLIVKDSVFNVLSSATVSNLIIQSQVGIESEVTAETRTMADYRGALANIGNGSVVTNVTNRADVAAFKAAGGIFGQMQGGELINCVNEGTIAANTYIGGLVGWALLEPFSVTGCLNEGSIERYNFNVASAGGIIGRIDYTNSVIDSCVNNGLVEIRYHSSVVGGIVGQTYSPILVKTGVPTSASDKMSNPDDQQGLSTQLVITNCVNNATIYGYNQIGGIVGVANSNTTMKNTVNNGNVTSFNNYAAGMVGRLGSNYDTTGNPDAIHTFENCVNNGDILGTNQYAAGMVGFCPDNVTFEYCVNNGDLSGKTKAHDAAGMVANCYYDVKCYYCVNTGSVSANRIAAGIAGRVGGKGAKGVDGDHIFEGCINTGTVYTSLDHYISSDAAFSHGTGGIVGTAYNAEKTELIVEKCVSLGSVTAKVDSKDGPTAVCGLVGFSNNILSTYANNYVAAPLSDGGSGYGVLAGITTAYSITFKADNFENNFVVNSILINYKDRKGLSLIDVNSVYSFRQIDLASGKLAATMYEEIGKDVFYQQLGVDEVPTPIKGEVTWLVRYDKVLDEYYNINKASEERPDPSETTEEEETTTEEVEDTTTEEVEESTTEEETTTEEVDETTTAEVEESTTEPEAETPADSDTEPSGSSDGGCGSVIGASVAIAALALIAPAAIVLKKRDEE